MKLIANILLKRSHSFGLTKRLTLYKIWQTPRLLLISVIENEVDWCCIYLARTNSEFNSKFEESCIKSVLVLNLLYDFFVEYLFSSFLKKKFYRPMIRFCEINLRLLFKNKNYHQVCHIFFFKFKHLKFTGKVII